MRTAVGSTGLQKKSVTSKKRGLWEKTDLIEYVRRSFDKLDTLLLFDEKMDESMRVEAYDEIPLSGNRSFGLCISFIRKTPIAPKMKYGEGIVEKKKVRRFSFSRRWHKVTRGIDGFCVGIKTRSSF